MCVASKGTLLGGNWFFLVEVPDLSIELGNLSQLNQLAKGIRW